MVRMVKRSKLSKEALELAGHLSALYKLAQSFVDDVNVVVSKTRSRKYHDAVKRTPLLFNLYGWMGKKSREEHRKDKIHKKNIHSLAIEGVLTDKELCRAQNFIATHNTISSKLCGLSSRYTGGLKNDLALVQQGKKEAVKLHAELEKMNRMKLKKSLNSAAAVLEPRLRDLQAQAKELEAWVKADIKIAQKLQDLSN